MEQLWWCLAAAAISSATAATATSIADTATATAIASTVTSVATTATSASLFASTIFTAVADSNFNARLGEHRDIHCTIATTPCACDTPRAGAATLAVKAAW